MTQLTNFQSLLNLSSVPLVNLSRKKLPSKSVGSGCLFKHLNKLVFATVAHNKKLKRKCAIQLRYVPSLGTEVCPLDRLHPIRLISASNLKRNGHVDFAYQQVPSQTEAYYQEINYINQTITKEEKILIHPLSSILPPAVDKEYGFCGWTDPVLEKHPHVTFLDVKRRIYCGLYYSEEKDGLLVFKLSFKHPGHKHFKGCSGAPIMAEDGTVVGLLKGGDKKKNEIYAIPLRRHRAALSVECS